MRVISNGAWGFAASRRVNKEEIARLAAEALEVAKAYAAARRSPLRLAPVKPATDGWITRTGWAASVSEKPTTRRWPGSQ